MNSTESKDEYEERNKQLLNPQRKIYHYSNLRNEVVPAKLPQPEVFNIEDFKIHQNQKNDSIKCDVCLWEDDCDKDELVICDMCLVATHQQCYGGEIFDTLPSGDWFCARCVYVKQNPKVVKCYLCFEQRGVLKQIDKQKWAHVQCVNWFNQIYFSDDSKEKIVGEVPNEFFSLTCCLCGKKKGACIQCDYKNCPRSFHVRCAAKKGLIKAWPAMCSELSKNGDLTINNAPVFCQQHASVGVEEFRKGTQKQHKKKTKRRRSPSSESESEALK